MSGWAFPVFFVAVLVLAAIGGFLPCAVRRVVRRNREDHP